MLQFTRTREAVCPIMSCSAQKLTMARVRIVWPRSMKGEILEPGHRKESLRSEACSQPNGLFTKDGPTPCARTERSHRH